MDFTFEKLWIETVEKVSENFGEKLDFSSLLFLIGVQELGKGYQPFSKQQKIELMHIAVCRLLEPSGYYQFEQYDADGWPHFQRSPSLPVLTGEEQDLLIRKAIIHYFKENEH